MGSMNKRRRGNRKTSVKAARVFTLLELLVVVAVFMLLASLLLPALAKAKERFSGLVCLNQQKQIFLGGLMMYAQDYNGWNFGCYYAKFGYDSNRSWVQVLCAAKGGYPGLGYFSFGYANGVREEAEKIFWCPVAVQKGPSLDPTNYGVGGTTYIMNYWLAKWDSWGCPWKYDMDRGLFKIESMKNPSAVAWLVDSVSYQGASTFSVYPFHSDASNVLFVDGHGKNMRLRSIYINTDYPYKGADSY